MGALRDEGGDAVEREPLLTILEAELAAAEAFAPCAAAGSDGACRWPVRRRKLKVRRPAPAQRTAHGPRHEELHVIRAPVRLAFVLCNYLTLARHSERAAGGGRHDLWCVQRCG